MIEIVLLIAVLYMIYRVSLLNGRINQLEFHLKAFDDALMEEDSDPNVEVQGDLTVFGTIRAVGDVHAFDNLESLNER